MLISKFHGYCRRPGNRVPARVELVLMRGGTPVFWLSFDNGVFLPISPAGGMHHPLLFMHHWAFALRRPHSTRQLARAGRSRRNKHIKDTENGGRATRAPLLATRVCSHTAQYGGGVAQDGKSFLFNMSNSTLLNNSADTVSARRLKRCLMHVCLMVFYFCYDAWFVGVLAG